MKCKIIRILRPDSKLAGDKNFERIYLDERGYRIHWHLDEYQFFGPLFDQLFEVMTRLAGGTFAAQC